VIFQIDLFVLLLIIIKIIIPICVVVVCFLFSPKICLFVCIDFISSSIYLLYLFIHSFVDELLVEKEKYKNVSDELDMTLNELSGY